MTSSTTPRSEPGHGLAPSAWVIWTAEMLLATVGATVAAVIAGSAITHQAHDGAWHTLGTVLPFAAGVLGVVLAVTVPFLRVRRWRWNLDDDELDLRRGIIVDTRTIVPVARIQHVDIRRTAWSQLFGVASVVVHTAAGTTEVPLLPEATAAEVRDRIAGLIRTPDDE
jgi:membrane protein YdbS with pleckstrin-like domain